MPKTAILTNCCISVGICLSVDTGFKLKISSNFSFLNDSISKTASNGKRWFAVPKALRYGLGLCLLITIITQPFGIQGVALKLLKSLLINCLQNVGCQKLNTNATINKFNVAQSSNFGLFNILMIYPILCILYLDYLQMTNMLSNLSFFTLNVRRKD